MKTTVTLENDDIKQAVTEFVANLTGRDVKSVSLRFDKGGNDPRETDRFYATAELGDKQG